MRKARFTAHQIIAVIRTVESGRTVKDVYREAGISEATGTTGCLDTAAWKLLILNLEDVNADLWSFFAIFNIRCLITSAVRFPPFHLH